MMQQYGAGSTGWQASLLIISIPPYPPRGDDKDFKIRILNNNNNKQTT